MGMIDEPAPAMRRLEMSVLRQSGCSIIAFITAGTTRVMVGRRRAIACSASPG